MTQKRIDNFVGISVTKVLKNFIVAFKHFTQNTENFLSRLSAYVIYGWSCQKKVIGHIARHIQATLGPQAACLPRFESNPCIFIKESVEAEPINHSYKEIVEKYKHVLNAGFIQEIYSDYRFRDRRNREVFTDEQKSEILLF